MGWDIHCFIEYEESPKGRRWESFGGRIAGGRDYELFTALAGIRVDQYPLEFIPPRGVPSDIGPGAREEYWLVVTDAEDPGRNEIGRIEAGKWLLTGRAISPLKGRVTDAGVHHGSWLTLAELKAALQQISHRPDLSYRGMVGAMEALEEHGAPTRLVFFSTADSGFLSRMTRSIRRDSSNA